MTEYLPELDPLLTSWELSMRARGLARNTVKMYLEGIQMYLRWCDEEGRPHELSRAGAREFVIHCLATKAPSTAQVRHKALRQFSKWMLDEGEVESDPLDGLETPAGHVKVIDPFTEDELRGMISACKGTTLRARRDEALLRFFSDAIVRASEALSLRPMDVDLPRGMATIERTKGRRGRVVPFGTQTATAIDRYMRVARRERRLTDDGPLWVGAQGKTLGYNGLDRTLKERAAAAGVPNFHIHRLRHTAASRWLAAGGSEQGLMTVAGWKSRSMLDRYTNATAAERAAKEARGLNLGDL